jgi:hypothetical protein
MVLEREIIPLWEWLFPGVDSNGALVTFVGVLAGLCIVSLLVAYLRLVVLHGPGEAFYVVAKSIATAVSADFPNTSCRRILALARLAILESLRWRVLSVFFVFAVVLLFAGWFLDTRSDHPARVYLSFVPSMTELLIVILAIAMSAFSLPNDIRHKTIHTVVTKPVRATEIVLGRIIGFCTIGTLMLVLMGAVSYVFVVRGLSHRHQIDSADVETLRNSAGEITGWKGITTLDSHHRHSFEIAGHGHGRVDDKQDHYHEITRIGEGDSAVFQVGPPRGALTAKVPIYGKIHFIDRSGRIGDGISVGKEWSYRKYIEGGTLAAAVWTFSNLRSDNFPDGLPLEMNLSVFRTYKGDIVSGILGSITLKNPTTGVSSEPLPFTAREFSLYRFDVPRKLKALDSSGALRDIELFTDLVDENGRVEIWIQCSEKAQYFGMAQPDLFITGREASFTVNFIKSYVGIWLQMVVITCFGVMFSTFLGSAVSMFATIVIYFVAMFREFIVKVATGEQQGGGPLESIIRLVRQQNIAIDLEIGVIFERVIKFIDAMFMAFMWLLANVLPDFPSFNTSQFVASGFNIDGNLLTEHFLIAMAFAVVLSVYGYFFLKSREIAG